MGQRRKDSDRFKIERLKKPEENRDTLSPCDPCGGKGYRTVKRVVEDAATHRTVDVQLRCNWCGGTGSVTRRLAVAFHRWTRILRHNRAKGLCPNEESG